MRLGNDCYHNGEPYLNCMDEPSTPIYSDHICITALKTQNINKSRDLNEHEILFALDLEFKLMIIINGCILYL